MEIQFFDDPFNKPRSREDVCIEQIGLFVHEDGRKVTYGLRLTPFLEPPCIDVEISNADGKPAGALSVIEQDKPGFSLVLHLRDETAVNPYQMRTQIYYTTPETERIVVDTQTISFDVAQEGEYIFKFEC